MRRVTLGTLAIGLCAALSSACGGGGGSATASPPAAAATSASPAVTASSATPSPSKASPTGPRPFAAKISKVTRATVKHSWHPGCPVGIGGLRLITMTYRGMDGRTHEGQMVVNADSASKIVKVFHTLYDQHYPIRRMELVDKYGGSDFKSIEADNTSAFNCRNATGASSWSQHAYGHAVDLNTCENPYVHPNGHIEHPRCVKYGDRKRRDPGLIHAGDKVVRAFRSIGWGWGGTWGGPWDFQHFSATGH
jgi:D-alanyl-D-alanine carboxypeptidase